MKDDLMVGDLVRFDGSVNYKNPQGSGQWVNCRVKAIGGLAFDGRTRFVYLDKAERKKPLLGGDDFQRSLGELSPISLDGNILNKVFPDTRHGVYWCWDDKKTFDEGENWYKVRIEKDGNKLLLYIRYVHELQHALRLCGIEKEITF